MAFSKQISNDSLVNGEKNQDKFQRKEANSENHNYCVALCEVKDRRFAPAWIHPHGGDAKSINDQEVKDEALKDYQNDELVIQNKFNLLLFLFTEK